jgi:uncharacterized protein (DUF934 family)
MMQEIIKDKAIVQDDWTVLRLAENETPDAVDVPAGKVIVPLKVWLLQRNVLEKRADIGVWFSSDEQAKDLEGDIARFSLLAVDFLNSLTGAVIPSLITCVHALALAVNCAPSAMCCVTSCSTCSA